MAESGTAKSQAPVEPATGISRHLGNENPWYVISSAPDYCRVGSAVVGFDSFTLLSKKSTASSNVKGQLGAKPIYRVGDMVSGVQANAGQGVCSTTSLGAGNVLFLTGQFNVKANGRMTVMDGAKCMINCNAAGAGNATAVLRTEVKTAAAAPPPRGMMERMGDESVHVLSEKWKSAKESAGTVWDALGWTSDDATAAAARTKIKDGFVNSAKGLAALQGAPPEMVEYAYLSGNPDAIAVVEALQKQQQVASGALIDGVKKSWNDASDRNGTAGAVAGVLTGVTTEVVGAKGLGAAGKLAGKAAGIGKAPVAGTAGQIPTPSANTQLPAPVAGAGQVTPVSNGVSSGRVNTDAASPSTVTPATVPSPSTPPTAPVSAAATPGIPATRAEARVQEIKDASQSPLEAAGRLDREIAAAKASGWTPDEIKELEQARKERLKRARSDASNRSVVAQNGGVHVKRGRLVPNSSYELNGYRYTTDDKGRISSVEGDLRLESADRDNYAQRTVGKNDGRLPGDQGGHYIGAQFGGYGGRENLGPMDAGVNNYHGGEWGEMEKNWAAKIEAGDRIHVRIEPVYVSGTDTIRPGSFNITETINGESSTRIIRNP